MNSASDSNFIQRLKTGSFLTGTAVLTIPVILYAIILSIPLSPGITDYARNGGPLVSLLILIAIVPAFKQSGWVGELWTFSIAAILFGMALSWNWTTGYYDGSLIGGLLPFSDASDYYLSAQALLAGDRLSDFASRRPLFTGLFSVMLGLTGLNLKLSLAIMGLLAAFSSLLLARAVRRSDGSITAAVVFMVQFLYFRAYIGKALTENLGVILGALGFALLWRSSHKGDKALYLLGILTLTFALVARAGAFFILPMLVVWGLWFFRTPGRLSKSFLVLSIGAVLLPFLLNQIIIRVVGSTQGQAFSNFSYTLYGLASGYKGWNYVSIEHPGVQESEIYPLAIARIRSDPQDLITGIVKSYQDFLNPGARHTFQFMMFWNTQGVQAYQILFVISAVGLVWCLMNLKTRQGSFILLSFLGVLLSVPFAPPIDASIMRVYAVTIPVVGLILGFGVTAPLRWLGLNLSEDKEPDDLLTGLSTPFTIFIISICLFGPLMVKFSGKIPPLPEKIDCEEGSELLTVFVNRESTVNLVKHASLNQSLAPNVRVKDFRARLIEHNNTYPELAQQLYEIPAGMSILHSLNLRALGEGRSAQNIWLIVNTSQLPEQSGLANFCARKSDHNFLKRYHFYDTQPIETADVNMDPASVMSNKKTQMATWFLFAVGIVILVEPIFHITGRFLKKRRERV